MRSKTRSQRRSPQRVNKKQRVKAAHANRKGPKGGGRIESARAGNAIRSARAGKTGKAGRTSLAGGGASG